MGCNILSAMIALVAFLQLLICGWQCKGDQ